MANRGHSRRHIDTNGLLESSLNIVDPDFKIKYEWYLRNFSEAELWVMGYAAFSMLKALGIRDIDESFSAVNRGSRMVGKMFSDRKKKTTIPRRKREHIFKPGAKVDAGWLASSRPSVRIQRGADRIRINWAARAPRPEGK